jgi:TPR repeat protein
LLRRGDALLGTGDITSARLFYEHVFERGANAANGSAALRMGATFDPAYASGGGVRGAADPAQSLLWYRRARELGVSEAEQRIERLDPGSAGEQDRRPRR